MTAGNPAQPGLMNIGEEAKPPFAILPDPSNVFLNRAKRLETLAAGHALEGYLRLISQICRAQSATVAKLPAARLPIAKADHPGMPRLQFDSIAIDEVATEALVKLTEALGEIDAPAAFQLAIRTISTMTPAVRQTLLQSALARHSHGDDIALHVLACAALQVHVTRLAAQLDASKIEPVADGVCPVCASQPAASAVVSWPQANNTRFCTCSLCATQWHVVRLKCVTCSSTAGVAYPHIEGHADGLRAETCDTCNSYVKIVYQVNDPALEPFADDIASLDLDLVLKNEGWKRGGRNPFLLGY